MRLILRRIVRAVVHVRSVSGIRVRTVRSVASRARRRTVRLMQIGCVVRMPTTVRRTVVRRSGCHDTVVKFTRLRGCGDGWLAMILRSQQRAIRAGGVFVLRLHGRWSDMMLVRSSPLRRVWLGNYSACPAVEADAIYGLGMHDRPIHIRRVNHRRIYVHHGCVVREDSAIPAPADESNSTVPKSIVNAAIETDMRSPIPAVPQVPAAAPAPISRSPKEAHGRRHNPRARHPEIAIRAISPISGSPKVTRTRANRLLVYRQRWRAYVHRDTDANLRR